MARVVGHVVVSPGQRFATGCIVTFSDGSVRHFTGEGSASVRAAAEHADRHALRVLTISTPQTIYRDLYGTRANLDPDRDKTNRSTNMNLPEPKMLGAIGRTDLLA